MEVVYIKAIPKSMLPHAVMLAREGEEDRWGNAELKNIHELNFVKIEPSSKIMRDKNNAEIQLAATLFYDCKNSRPHGVSFCLGDIIIFCGNKYRVKLIDPLYCGKRPHHYEIGLVAYA